MSFEIASLFNL